MSISLSPFSLALAPPLETARGEIAAREGFVVAVERGGTRGIGEATPLPGWTESLTVCERALRRAIDAIEGSRKTGGSDLEAALGTLDAGETPAARHGLESALADLRAREATIPLYRHLGGDRVVERVPVNATIGDGTPEETAGAVETAIEDGFRCLKVKVGARDVEADTARLRAVRERADAVAHAGTEAGIEIRADANGAWSREEAREALAAFEGLWGNETGSTERGRKDGGDEHGTRLAYVEQPLSAADLAGHAELYEESGIPVALDESLRAHSLAEIIDAEAADVLVCKPMAFGGLDRVREGALRARAAGIAPVVTTTIDGAVARAGATHFAASLAPIDACGLATADLLAEDLVGNDPAPISDGYALVPRGPGALEAGLRGEAMGESESY